MGLRSGEYWGRKIIHAPRVRRTAWALALLWTKRLSRITTSPGARVRASCLDIDIEGLAIYCAWYDPRGRQLIVTQASDERLGAPFAKRGARLEPCSLFFSAAVTRHLGVDRSLVDKHQSFGMTTHPGLSAVDPAPAPL
jgi:hypothetical protein